MWANKGREENDQIKTGMMIGGTENNVSGTYMLWRGASMKQEWLQDYAQNIGSSVKFKSVTSMSRSLKVALTFAFNNRQEGFYPTLFVCSCSNYQGILGIAMNNQAYTAYPYEGEVVFMDGATVNVWCMETMVPIKNLHEDMRQFNNEFITIIHVFHAK